MKMYELSPSGNETRKSFCHKAIVVENERGDQTLFSYLTPIILRHWDGWTITTGRHITSFCGLHKEQFLALPVTEVA